MYTSGSDNGVQSLSSYLQAWHPGPGPSSMQNEAAQKLLCMRHTCMKAELAAAKAELPGTEGKPRGVSAGRLPSGKPPKLLSLPAARLCTTLGSLNRCMSSSDVHLVASA